MGAQWHTHDINQLAGSLTSSEASPNAMVYMKKKLGSKIPFLESKMDMECISSPLSHRSLCHFVASPSTVYRALSTVYRTVQVDESGI